MRNILTLILFLAVITLSAQNYSPCYKEKYQQGVALYNSGKYKEAKEKFVAAKGCPVPNTKEADEWIGKCNAKLNPQPKPDPIPIVTEDFVVKGCTFKMVKVEGGTFIMGWTAEQGKDYFSNEKPKHEVTVSSFWMGETEVTQMLWEAVMGNNPSYFIGDNLPVESVSWHDCKQFCQKLNEELKEKIPQGWYFTLPTEAEWEYSARGGNRHSNYKYAGGNDLGSVAWCAENSGDLTHPVKGKKANALGLHDMSGNVEELCSDWKGAYSTSAQTDPLVSLSGLHLVVTRGGYYNSYKGGDCRVAERGSAGPDNRRKEVGFRLALVQRTDSSDLSLTKEYTVNGTSFMMIFVEGGTFQMGVDGSAGNLTSDKEELPKHTVTVSDFWMGETEVTQAMWKAVMGSRNRYVEWTEKDGLGPDYPAYMVSWDECIQFCNKLNDSLADQLPSGWCFALPTEAQWEYAARGGNKSHCYRYSGGDNFGEVCWGRLSDESSSHPVKTKRKNELGLYDMSGNVWEWCADWYDRDYYNVSPSNDPLGPTSGKYRVMRGGSWGSPTWDCRVFGCRGMSSPENRSKYDGFRIALVRRQNRQNSNE